MKISELIIRLQEIQEKYGDLECINTYHDNISPYVDENKHNGNKQLEIE